MWHIYLYNYEALWIWFNVRKLIFELVWSMARFLDWHGVWLVVRWSNTDTLSAFIIVYEKGSACVNV